MASGILAKRTRNVGYHSVSPGDTSKWHQKSVARIKRYKKIIENLFVHNLYTRPFRSSLDSGELLCIMVFLLFCLLNKENELHEKTFCFLGELRTRRDEIRSVKTRLPRSRWLVGVVGLQQRIGWPRSPWSRGRNICWSRAAAPDAAVELVRRDQRWNNDIYFTFLELIFFAAALSQYVTLQRPVKTQRPRETTWAELRRQMTGMRRMRRVRNAFKMPVVDDTVACRHAAHVFTCFPIWFYYVLCLSITTFTEIKKEQTNNLCAIYIRFLLFYKLNMLNMC